MFTSSVLTSIIRVADDGREIYTDTTPLEVAIISPEGVVVRQAFMVEKRCFKCGETKPLSEFYRHPGTRDGYLNKCKECAKTDSKSRRDNRPEKDLETRLKSCRKNPTHKNAAMAIDAALRCGRIKKASHCQGCGRSGTEVRLSAHHHDYSEPLDVVWVCAACHRQLDHMRAYVESGKSWSEYRRERTNVYNAVRRALEFYEANASLRKPFSAKEILKKVKF